MISRTRLDGLSVNTITATMRVTGRDLRRPNAALATSRSQQMWVDAVKDELDSIRQRDLNCHAQASRGVALSLLLRDLVLLRSRDLAVTINDSLSCKCNYNALSVERNFDVDGVDERA